MQGVVADWPSAKMNRSRSILRIADEEAIVGMGGMKKSERQLV